MLLAPEPRFSHLLPDGHFTAKKGFLFELIWKLCNCDFVLGRGSLWGCRHTVLPCSSADGGPPIEELSSALCCAELIFSLLPTLTFCLLPRPSASLRGFHRVRFFPLRAKHHPLFIQEFIIAFLCVFNIKLLFRIPKYRRAHAHLWVVSMYTDLRTAIQWTPACVLLARKKATQRETCNGVLLLCQGIVKVLSSLQWPPLSPSVGQQKLLIAAKSFPQWLEFLMICLINLLLGLGAVNGIAVTATGVCSQGFYVQCYPGVC